LNDVRVRQAIARLKCHDIAGLETLVHVYQLKAVRAAFLIVSDSSLAEDIVQTAFLHMADKIDQYDDHRPFGPWFMRIVVNFALQALRQPIQELSLEMTLSPDSTATLTDVLADETLLLDEQIEQREFSERIRQALNDLPPLQRAAIVMRYYLDMSEQDMVDALHLPKGTIKWRLHAARQQLRILLSTLSPSFLMSGQKEVVHDR
jgi:RNA polymerase sigma-70 factor (ECF subfamily)